MAKRKIQAADNAAADGGRAVELERGLPSGLRVRNLGIRRVRVGDIVDNPLNHRMHGSLQRDAFGGVVNELGWYGYPDVYQTPERPGLYVLIDGELRTHTLVARYGVEAFIDVNLTDFDEHEARKALATHDTISGLADNDAERVDALLREVATGSAAVQEMLDALATDAGLYKTKRGEGDDEDGDEDGDEEVVTHEQAVQLRPNREYALVFADSAEEWDAIKSLLSLVHVRRGGYTVGSAQDQVSIERVVGARRLLDAVAASALKLAAADGGSVGELIGERGGPPQC